MKLHAQVFTVALLGASFAVLLSPLAVAVQLVPHTYPEGQHPPPADAAQEAHPFAHEPELAAVAVVEASGTTTVAPELTISVLALLGQDVVSQLRPVLQQPPR